MEFFNLLEVPVRRLLYNLYDYKSDLKDINNDVYFSSELLGVIGDRPKKCFLRVKATVVPFDFVSDLLMFKDCQNVKKHIGTMIEHTGVVLGAIINTEIPTLEGKVKLLCDIKSLTIYVEGEETKSRIGFETEIVDSIKINEVEEVEEEDEDEESEYTKLELVMQKRLQLI
jgi:hypothetical protein